MSFGWCAREASVNAGGCPAGAIRRFSTDDLFCRSSFMWFMGSLRPASSTPCLLSTSHHGDAIYTTYDAAGNRFTTVRQGSTGSQMLQEKTLKMSLGGSP